MREYWILEMRKFKEGSVLLKSVSLLHIKHVFIECKLWPEEVTEARN